MIDSEQLIAMEWIEEMSLTESTRGQRNIVRAKVNIRAREIRYVCIRGVEEREGGLGTYVEGREGFGDCKRGGYT